ncbi:MAG: thiamine phosphate synthase [Crocinitomicaceae bacterium]
MLKIVISYPSELPNEINLVNELLDSDIDYFHIRKPEFEEFQMTNFIEQLDEVNHHKIIISSYYSLINKYNLGGIHLNKKGLSSLRTAEESDKCFIEPLLLKNNKIYVYNQEPTIISYAAHNFDDIENVNFKVDYFTLSPIFDSISKTGYQSNFTDHNALRLSLSKTVKKIIALGGVSENKIPKLINLGFSGHARLGDYWRKYTTQILNT